MENAAITDKSLPGPENGPPEKTASSNSIVVRVGLTVLALVTIAASFLGGAIFAVGTPRLMGTISSPPANTVLTDIPQYIAIPETPYELHGGRSQGYLLASISLKTTQYDYVETLMPEIQTVIQAYMRELSVEDLKGATGLYRIRRDCLYRVRKIAGTQAIENIFITDIVVR